ncbi:DUF4132 domain-containing protein [Actinomadura sp. WAC 06369]|uniref:DUF4132 domain-containing protein n=1 Tax=Actinomadura sp. WAC 06369 TaxID=2203193 RepID=UPI000F786FF2|nr:DUF4132 domain-containing protein [Actinomadura sp. WAC 06369]RSN53921.1 hypothetical protein DMH08_27340 [Actinomadura sp. WAC 06369]
MSDTELPDERSGEDVLVLPPAWLRQLHPRRGGRALPPARGGRAKEVPVLLEAAADALAALPSDEEVEAGLRDAARRHLGGEPDAVGAAVVAAVAMAGEDGGPEGRARAFVDHWRAGHGLGFAACAAVELSRVRIAERSGRRLPVSTETPSLGFVWPETLRYVRRLLAAAPDDRYADAVRRLAGHRTTAPRRRVVSYLVPTEADWLEESAADPSGGGDRELKLFSIDRAELFGDPPSPLFFPDVSRPLLATLLDACGTDVLPLLLATLDNGLPEHVTDVLLEAVALLPADDAFAALLERSGRPRVRPALMSMMERFPVRAARLLAATDTAYALNLLRIHLTARPDLAEHLPEGARAVLGPRDATPEADPATLPAPLPGLPWDAQVKPIVQGLEAPATRTVVWADGERDKWALAGLDEMPVPEDIDWDDLEAAFGKAQPQLQARIAVYGPEEGVRPLLAAWDDPPAWLDGEWGRSLVARYEQDALPFAHRMAKEAQQRHAALLVPFLDAEVTAVMGAWLARGTRGADAARDWCDRHGLAAVPFAAPAALARPAARRRAAEAVLRRVAEKHGVDAVADAVPAAADALRTVLTAHPAATGLLRRPKVPTWADPALLPRVLLRGREQALRPETTETFVELLAMPELGDLDAVARVCDPASLAEFGLALFEGWRSDRMPAEHGWALARLDRLADDSAVPVLAPHIRSWPGKDRMHSAKVGLDVLVGIGTDTALTVLHDLAVRWPGRTLRKAAERAFARAADARGVPPGVLGDRLVPDLGLDGDGAVTVDYGRRRFTVRFDARLRPVVTDEDGVLRKSLPKPGKRDDPRVAPAAHAAFGELRKKVADAAALQIARLEDAMRTGRTWTPEQFRDYAVRGPLVRQIARRLVWLADEDGGATAFRIAEDGTFADAGDDVFTPSGAARITVAHPARLGAAAGTWAGILADYELLQPFPQLDHPVWSLTEEELAGSRLERFAGRDVRKDIVYELLSRGWTRIGPRNDIEAVARRTADGGWVVAEFGADAGDGECFGIRVVRAATEPGENGTPVPFGALDPVGASEALTDLVTTAERTA